MSLRDDLLAEYLTFKAKIRAGQTSVSNMNEREQAGLCLKLGGENALSFYDEAHGFVKTTEKKYKKNKKLSDGGLWPRARKLIEQALQEPFETPGEVAPNVPETCPKCGGANHPRELAWYQANYRIIATKPEKSDLEQQLLATSEELMVLGQRLGRLCGSAEGQTAKDKLAAIVRELMPKP